MAEPKNNLRRVTITVDDDGHLGKVEHPDRTVDKPVLPLSGKQYGWSLKKYEKTGIDLDAFLAQSVDVATSPPDNKEHMNTIQLQGPELLKLDVGHWGAYHRWREYPHGPKSDATSRAQGVQREFGMIENHQVWLCRYEGRMAVPDTAAVLEEAGAVLAAEVARNLCPALDIGIEIVAFAPVTDPRAAELDPKRLYVIFPDFHLPETLPDFPSAAQRNGDAAARKELRKLLGNSQHQPGLIYANPVDSDDQRALQEHLESIHVAPGHALPSGPAWNVLAGTYGFRRTVPFTPEQFLAEKAIVDREIQLTSTWFYARGQSWTKNAEDRDAPAAVDDDGDPTPAVDLVHLLCAVKKARAKAGGAIQVIQVGDLYELWLNHEFLYRFFAHDTSYTATEPSAYKAIWAKGSTRDDYQHRMDAEWKDHGARHPHNEKRYVFNRWPKLPMLHRYRIGDAAHAGLDDVELHKKLAIPPGQKDRLQALLRDRVDRVRAYTLHDPIFAATIRLRDMDPAILDFDHYYRKVGDPRKLGMFEAQGAERQDAKGNYLDPHKRREVFWNEMILDLLRDLGFRNIGGNHDGYRADPLLNPLLLAQDHAETVISEPGLWIEHSHRWDEFNRDGMAFGAGAANYVYYYFNDLCSKFSGKLEDMLGKQEQSSFVPGAALWFALANFGGGLKWLTDQKIPATVKPFGVYASGHTHSASLARIAFKFTPKPPRPAGDAADAPREYGPKW